MNDTYDWYEYITQRLATRRPDCDVPSTPHGRDNLGVSQPLSTVQTDTDPNHDDPIRTADASDSRV